MKYDKESVNSIYNGQLFKSKLEAKWAFMFDRFEWKWSYEPKKTGGKVPDFILKGNPFNVLVEVKPQIFQTKEWLKELYEAYKLTQNHILVVSDKPFYFDSYDILCLGKGWQYLDCPGDDFSDLLDWHMKQEKYDFGSNWMMFDGCIGVCRQRKNFIFNDDHNYIDEILLWWIEAEYTTGIKKYVPK